MNLSIERVEWDDSTNIIRWLRRDEIVECEVKHCVSVGFLLHEDAKQVWLVQSDDQDAEDDDHHFNNAVAIPKVAITRREVIIARSVPVLEVVPTERPNLGQEPPR